MLKIKGNNVLLSRIRHKAFRKTILIVNEETNITMI